MDFQRSTGRLVRICHFGVATLVLFGLLMVCGPVRALNPEKSLRHYVHAVYQIEDGLPQNTVTSLVQTRDGYIWLGGFEGLVRFDGVSFKVFNSANTPEILHNSIACLHEHTDGTLWIGTEGGGLVSYHRGHFQVLKKEHGLEDTRINAITEDANENLIVGTMGGSLYLVTSERKVIAIDPGDVAPKQEIYALLVDPEGRLWVAAADGLFCRENEKTTRYGKDNGLPTDFIRSLYRDREGNLWIGTAEGLIQWVDGAKRVYTTEDGLGVNMIYAIYEDSDLNLWIGTEFGGLAVKRGDTLTSFGVEDGISSPEVCAFVEDREGNLWVGTQTGGLNRFSDGSVVTYTTQDGLPSNGTWNIIETPDGAIWIATTGGLSEYKDGVFTNYRPDDNHIFIAGLVRDAEGTFWIGEDTRGFGTFKDGEFNFFGKRDGFAGYKIRSILSDSKGNIWIGTRADGIYLYADGKFNHFSTAEGLPDSSVRAIMEARDGRLYFGTRDGLAIYDEGKFKVIREEDGLPHNQIFFFHQDDEDRIWMAFYGGGIGCYMDGKYYSARIVDGLNTDLLYAIIGDDVGNMWYSTNLGISMVKKQDLLDLFAEKIDRVQPRTFGLADGMKLAECNGGSQYCGMKSSDGRIWFPTHGGYSVIDPTNLVLNETAPRVHIESVFVDGEDVLDGVVLPPGSHRIEFTYVGLNYVAPKQISFQYMLEGFDENWIDAGYKRTTFYTNIPPGEYRFRVKACNNEGICNNEGASFRFTLEPHFTQTEWFWPLVAAIALLIGASLYYVRVRSVKRQQTKVTKLAWEKTKAALDSQVGSMREMTEAIAGISTTMKNMSKKLATTSTGLEAAVSSTGIAVEELEAAGIQSGHNAEQIVSASSKTVDTARLGGDAVEETRSIMKNALDGSTEIDDKSANLLGRLTKVDTILSIINSIADQSRVLAINASIEAASAGEYGAGFGVVAKEMLELADQIKEQNAQVTELLIHSHTGIRDIAKNAEQSKAEMEKGVQSVEGSRSAVSDLSAELGSNTKLARIIKQATDEQRSGLSLISTEIQSVYSAASENTTIADEVGKEAKALGEFVRKLTEVIENWKTPEMYL